MRDIVTQEMLESYRAKHWILEGELTYNTITQAVELLERALRDLHVNPGDFESDETEMMIQAFLARYHASSPPQPEPLPPQK